MIMGEEMNQQLFYFPIGSEDEPIPFDGKVEIEEFTVPETKHDWGLSSFSVSFNARIKRLRLKMFKLPRKTKKRLKTQISKAINVKTKDIKITGINDIYYGTKSESR